jgi:hypothetical protein
MNISDSSARNTEGSGYFDRADNALQCADFLNGTLIKFGDANGSPAGVFRRTLLAGVPPLAKAVTHVFASCAEKQMIRVDTGWIVAAMADVHAFDVRSICNQVLIGKAVGITFEASALENAITHVVDRCRPQPASRVWFRDVMLLEASHRAFSARRALPDTKRHADLAMSGMLMEILAPAVAWDGGGCATAGAHSSVEDETPTNW